METALWKHEHKISNKEISLSSKDCNKIMDELVEKLGQISQRTLYLDKEHITIGPDKISTSIQRTRKLRWLIDLMIVKQNVTAGRAHRAGYLIIICW